MAPLPAKDTLLVIFGAGASFDSLAPGHIADPVSFAFKPPLTKFVSVRRGPFRGRDFTRDARGYFVAAGLRIPSAA